MHRDFLTDEIGSRHGLVFRTTTRETMVTLVPGRA
jgi:hypothetical protein